MVRNQKQYAIFYVLGMVVLILLMTILSACGSLPTADSVASMFENSWGINLPNNMELEFYEYERIWLGDGISYVVFKVETEPTNLIADFSNRKSEIFESTVSKLANEADYDIPSNLLPKWEVDYVWKHISKHVVDSTETPLRYFKNIYLIYFKNISRLIICENLI